MGHVRYIGETYWVIQWRKKLLRISEVISALMYIKTWYLDFFSIYYFNFQIEDNIYFIDLKSCCPSKRHKRHQHFQHLNSGYTEKDETGADSYIHPPNDIEKIIEILDEERKMLDAIDGEGSTLENCMSKEIFGKENVDLPIRSDVAAVSYMA